MRIGLDMDDTICGTDETLTKYAEAYCKEKNIDKKTLWEDETIRNDFLDNNLTEIYQNVPIKKGAVKTIKKLKELGHEVYVITARKNKHLKVDAKELTLNYLKKEGIIVDDVITDAKDKCKICDDLDINIILEDSDYNFFALEKDGFDVILFDEFNKHKDIKKRVTNWKDFLKYVK